ncbi:MAG: archease [Chloroflexota bacterium]|nr:archease [Chloroflexota bacterium]
MAYEYLDHQADVGIRASGDTLEEAVAEGARAMFGLMTDLDRVGLRVEVTIHCRADDVAALFIECLNELLFQSDVRRLLFADLQVKRLEHTPSGYELEAIARGEPLDATKHDLWTEVKAATYAGLRYDVPDGRHVLQCVLDV